MSDFYFTAPLGEDRTLCLAPLTDRRVSMAGEPVPDTSGYFLYEQRGTGEAADIEIIARVPSEDAALRLREMLGLS